MNKKLLRGLAQFEMDRHAYSIYDLAALAVVWKIRFFGLVLVYAVSIAALLVACTR